MKPARRAPRELTSALLQMIPSAALPIHSERIEPHYFCIVVHYMGSWLDILGPGMMPVEGGGGYHLGSPFALPTSLQIPSATWNESITRINP